MISAHTRVAHEGWHIHALHQCYFFISGSLLPCIPRCLIYWVLEGGHKSTKIRLEMGVTIVGDSLKSGKNTYLLVMICMRLLQTNWSNGLDES